MPGPPLIFTCPPGLAVCTRQYAGGVELGARLEITARAGELPGLRAAGLGVITGRGVLAGGAGKMHPPPIRQTRKTKIAFLIAAFQGESNTPG